MPQIRDQEEGHQVDSECCWKICIEYAYLHIRSGTEAEVDRPAANRERQVQTADNLENHPTGLKLQDLGKERCHGPKISGGSSFEELYARITSERVVRDGAQKEPERERHTRQQVASPDGCSGNGTEEQRIRDEAARIRDPVCDERRIVRHLRFQMRRRLTMRSRLTDRA